MPKAKYIRSPLGIDQKNINKCKETRILLAFGEGRLVLHLSIYQNGVFLHRIYTFSNWAASS